MKYIEFSNEILSPLFSSLSSFKLDVTDSITRRKFLRLIKYIVADKEETVNEISIKYSVKNTDGKPHILDNGRYEYTKEGRNSLYSDLKKLESETSKIELSNIDIETVNKMKDIIIRESDKYKEKHKEMTNSEHEYIFTLMDCARVLNEVKE